MFTCKRKIFETRILTFSAELSPTDFVVSFELSTNSIPSTYTITEINKMHQKFLLIANSKLFQINASVRRSKKKKNRNWCSSHFRTYFSSVWHPPFVRLMVKMFSNDNSSSRHVRILLVLPPNLPPFTGGGAKKDSFLLNQYRLFYCISHPIVAFSSLSLHVMPGIKKYVGA